MVKQGRVYIVSGVIVGPAAGSPRVIAFKDSYTQLPIELTSLRYSTTKGAATPEIIEIRHNNSTIWREQIVSVSTQAPRFCLPFIRIKDDGRTEILITPSAGGTTYLAMLLGHYVNQ